MKNSKYQIEKSEPKLKSLTIAKSILEIHFSFVFNQLFYWFLIGCYVCIVHHSRARQSALYEMQNCHNTNTTTE